MVTQSSGRDPVEKLAEEFAERYRRGERPSLAEYTNRYPELAAEIRELFPALVEMEQLASVEGPHPSTRRMDFGALPRQLGEYRLVREIGHGGMGVVYEAVQESLGRHVALKVLPLHGLLNQTQLERFKREAKAAARLHHTNIVPVFGVGQDHGIHYYAMQYIQGQSLDKVLDDVRRLRQDSPAPSLPSSDMTLGNTVARGLVSGCFAPDAELDIRVHQAVTECPGVSAEMPLSGSTAAAASTESSAGALTGLSESQYFRSAARVALQVVDALAYAHQQGILHRDIKPANLLLDTHGTVWITDFGLAKGEDSDDLTNTGDLVGTLRFMAPERFEGRCDVRSEVYSLGATLYEMLTLRPAFGQPDRMALLEEIRFHQPVRPAKCDRHIPRDLETIVLKAMAKEPAERYPSADALADDLRRYLADRPIRARRTPWPEQLWRWCRRNPAVASLISVVALLLVCIAVGSLLTAVWAVNAKKNLQDEQLAKEIERNRADHAEREALDSGLNSYLAAVARAKAHRFSRRMGQRFEALKAIKEAAQVARRLNLPEERIMELRNEAIACMALPDLQVAKEWDGWPAGSIGPAFDGDLERYARADSQGHVTIRRIADDHEMEHFKMDAGETWLGCTPDFRYAVINGKKGVYVYDISSRMRVLIRKGPSSSFAFTTDGRQFALGEEAGPVEIYRVASGKQVLAPRFPTQEHGLGLLR
jgi:serine/threonine protein kinase